MPDPASQQEFSDLYTDNERDLYGFVFSLLPNHTDADDVMQESMAQLWEHFTEYDATRPFLPWARRFAYRQVLMHRRREGVRRRFFSDVIVESLAQDYPASTGWEEQKREALKYCLSECTQEELELLQHRYQGDTSLNELAMEQGRSVNAIYKSLQRIRAKLVKCVQFRMAPEAI